MQSIGGECADLSPLEAARTVRNTSRVCYLFKNHVIHAKFPQSKVLNEQKVTDFVKHQDSTDVITTKGKFNGKFIITCAGLQSDRIAKKEGTKSDVAIVGFRGDYYDLSEKGMHKVKNLIYPVPNPQFPFLGVHLPVRLWCVFSVQFGQEALHVGGNGVGAVWTL